MTPAKTQRSRRAPEARVFGLERGCALRDRRSRAARPRRPAQSNAPALIARSACSRPSRPVTTMILASGFSSWTWAMVAKSSSTPPGRPSAAPTRRPSPGPSGRRNAPEDLNRVVFQARMRRSEMNSNGATSRLTTPRAVQSAPSRPAPSSPKRPGGEVQRENEADAEPDVLQTPARVSASVAGELLDEHQARDRAEQAAPELDVDEQDRERLALDKQRTHQGAERNRGPDEPQGRTLRGGMLRDRTGASAATSTSSQARPRATSEATCREGMNAPENADEAISAAQQAWMTNACASREPRMRSRQLVGAKAAGRGRPARTACR